MNKVADIIKSYKINSMAMYRYIKTSEMIEHVTTIDNIKYVDDTGLEKIINKFCNNKNEKSYNNDSTSYNSDISLLQLEITMLKQQTTAQNEYIGTLREQIKELQQDKSKLFTELEQQRILHLNTQELHRQSQKKIFLLENRQEQKNPDKGKSFFEKLRDFIKN